MDYDPDKMPPSPDDTKWSRMRRRLGVITTIMGFFEAIPIGCAWLAALLHITHPIGDERYVLIRPGDVLLSLVAWSCWAIIQVFAWSLALYTNEIRVFPWMIGETLGSFVILGFSLRLLFDYSARVAAKNIKK